uniref:YhcH/YjgK/YiaL family protein n=1 Tax=Alistipes sp. TaxID=1872444 RepID=UPI004056A97B
MIVDSLKNAHLYYTVAPRLKEAFEALAQFDLESLAPGKYEIRGEEIFLNLVERELKSKQEAKLEVHDKYIDVQIVLRGQEGFGWSERADMKLPQSEFNQEKDIQFFDDQPQTYYTLREGQFTILLPEDSHAPLVGEGPIRKAIIKVML